jgi:Rieske Fe-S protein
VYLHWQEDKILAFNVKCPHLGCDVEYRKTPEEQVPEYYCPCHMSAFTLTGEMKTPTPLRNLDSLDVKVVKNDKDVEELWVKYQVFRTGRKETVPV